MIVASTTRRIKIKKLNNLFTSTGIEVRSEKEQQAFSVNFQPKCNSFRGQQLLENRDLLRKRIVMRNLESLWGGGQNFNLGFCNMSIYKKPTL